MPFSALKASLINSVSRDSYSKLVFIAPFSLHLLMQSMYLAAWLTRLQLFLEAFPFWWTTADRIQRTSTAFQWSSRCDTLTNPGRKTKANNSYYCEQINPNTIISAVGDCFRLLSVYLITPWILDFFLPVFSSQQTSTKERFKSTLLRLTQGSRSIAQSNVYLSTK